jgi:hypothetical protein
LGRMCLKFRFCFWIKAKHFLNEILMKVVETSIMLKNYRLREI